MLESVPLLTRAPAVASLSTVNERLPALAAVVAVAVTAVGTVDVAANTFQPDSLDRAEAAVLTAAILVLMLW